jgi:hypothetical protein
LVLKKKLKLFKNLNILLKSLIFKIIQIGTIVAIVFLNFFPKYSSGNHGVGEFIFPSASCGKLTKIVFSLMNNYRKQYEINIYEQIFKY